MKKKRQKPENIRVRCPYCGRMARLHPASYVYGSDNLDSDAIRLIHYIPELFPHSNTEQPNEILEMLSLLYQKKILFIRSVKEVTIES